MECLGVLVTQNKSYIIGTVAARFSDDSQGVARDLTSTSVYVRANFMRE